MNEQGVNLDELVRNLSLEQPNEPLPFKEYLSIVQKRPEKVLRNIYTLFSDMVLSQAKEQKEQFPDDPRSIHYVRWDIDSIFVTDSDRPFYMDTPLANRLVDFSKSLRQGATQNKFNVRIGEPGSGKTRFFYNLLKSLEDYANTEEESLWEVVWRLEADRIKKGDVKPQLMLPGFDESHSDYVDVPCPSHDDPLLLIPRENRKKFLVKLLGSQDTHNLIKEKSFEWLLTQEPCAICDSMYRTLLERSKSPEDVFSMLYARRYLFDRKTGCGISVYNAPDQYEKQRIIQNEGLQRTLDGLFGDSTRVQYKHSRLADTNRGVYVLMDTKGENVRRFTDLHGVISDGVHKVGNVEETIDSLFFGVANPGDWKALLEKIGEEQKESFEDRTSRDFINYVLDYPRELEMYRDHYGKRINKKFLPHVMEAWGKIIVASRMGKSEHMEEWIQNNSKYAKMCDDDFKLLRMELYRDYIPEWLKEDDFLKFDKSKRKKIIGESQQEGKEGITGRKSLSLFGAFITTYPKDKERSYLTIQDVVQFFQEDKSAPDFQNSGKSFLDSLVGNYEFEILQEVKECLFRYDEEAINRNLMNYMESFSYSLGMDVYCKETGDEFQLNAEFIRRIGSALHGTKDSGLIKKRRDQEKSTYSRETLPQLKSGVPLQQTTQFGNLHASYVHHLKKNVLDKYEDNENFRTAVKAYGTSRFAGLEDEVRQDVEFLYGNMEKRGYSQDGTKHVVDYVLSNNLPDKFS